MNDIFLEISITGNDELGRLKWSLSEHTTLKALREATHFQPLKRLHLSRGRVSLGGGNFQVCRNRVKKVSIIFQILISQNIITKNFLAEDSIPPTLII